MNRVYIVHHELYSKDRPGSIVAYRPLCLFATLAEARKYVDGQTERRAKTEGIPHRVTVIEGEDSYRAHIDGLNHVQWVAHSVSSML